MKYRCIQVQTLTPHIGAEVSGVDLCAPLSDEVEIMARVGILMYPQTKNRRWRVFCIYTRHLLTVEIRCGQICTRLMPR